MAVLFTRGGPKHPPTAFLVDDADVPTVSQYAWRLRIDRRGKVYVMGQQPGSGSTVYLHRLLMDPPVGMEVDHRNCNGLDNRRRNLRVATHAQNQANRRRCAAFKGVTFDKRANAWRARLGVDCGRQCLGTYATPGEAASAYDAAARAAFGEFARLNFPRAGELAA